MRVLLLTTPALALVLNAPMTVKKTTTTKLSAATLEAPVAPAKVEAVELAACPLTQWGDKIDVVAEQVKARQEPAGPFMHELRPPAEVSEEKQEQWLLDNAEEIKDKMSSHGAVIFRGWDLLKTPEGFRRAYEAIGMSPCLDPLHAVSARPMVDKKSAVYEAVNGESRANFFIGMHNEFVGTRSPRAAMFVCFKAAEKGGEFLLADGRAIFRDVDTDLLKRLYSKQIRYSVMELPFFGFVDKIPIEPLASAVGEAVRSVVSMAINAKVDFDVKMSWLDDSTYADEKTLQARAPAQPPVVTHPSTGVPTWFCNVHSHSARLRKKREAIYGADLGTGVSRINKSDMFFGDDDPLTAADLDHLDDITNKHMTYVAMRPGDAVLLDNYLTMHGRATFEGSRKHAVTWFE